MFKSMCTRDQEPADSESALSNGKLGVCSSNVFMKEMYIEYKITDLFLQSHKYIAYFLKRFVL